jgi:hypothetical protein
MKSRTRPFLFLWFAAMQLALLGAASRTGTRVDAVASKAGPQTESHQAAKLAADRTAEGILRRIPATPFTPAAILGIELPSSTSERPLPTVATWAADARVVLPRSRAPPALS